MPNEEPTQAGQELQRGEPSSQTELSDAEGVDLAYAQTKLSDAEGVDLAYALLMDAIGSKEKQEVFKASAQATFKQFRIELSDADLEKIKPELAGMLELAKKRGLLGTVEHALDQNRQTTGALHTGLGKAMQSRRNMTVSELGAQALLALKGGADLMIDIVKSTLTWLDRMAKKLSFSVGKLNVHASFSERDALVGGMIRKINEGKRGAQRKVFFTGRVMSHAARVHKARGAPSR